MTRNLSKRVELLVPIEDNSARKRLIGILETHFSDTTQGRLLQSDGSYVTIPFESGKALRSQEVFVKEAAKRARQQTQPPDTLVPHLPLDPTA